MNLRPHLFIMAISKPVSFYGSYSYIINKIKSWKLIHGSAIFSYDDDDKELYYISTKVYHLLSRIKFGRLR